MPAKDVIVSVTGLQVGGGAEPDFIELVTEGTYEKKGGIYYISYKEADATGMDGTTTTIKAAGDVITLMRAGAVNSQFVFQRGKRHISHYETVYGAFTVAITANNVDVEVGERGGNIHLGYEVDIDESGKMYNDLIVEIKPAAGARSAGGFQARRPSRAAGRAGRVGRHGRHGSGRRAGRAGGGKGSGESGRPGTVAPTSASCKRNG
jgi:uncharacterized beta-barrel protein YwiB (DUF1934 family)